MARMKESTSMRLMIIHGFMMIALGLALFYIRASMTNLLADIFGSVFALLLVAASLLLIAVLDWICAIGLGAHQVARLRGLLLVSTAAAGCGIFLVLYPRGTFQMLSYAIALYAFLLSIGKFRMARYWRGSWLEQGVMYILASIAFLFSALLVVIADRSEPDIVAGVAGYALFLGLQMLLTIFYLEQHSPKAIGRESRSSQAQL